MTNDSKRVGFTASVTLKNERDGREYHTLAFPKNTVQSLRLAEGDLVDLEIRNMQGDTVSLTRKVQGTRQKKVYLPRGDVTVPLDLEKGDLVDVFAEKKD